MTAPTPTAAEQYPIRGVRFVNGRTTHRVQRPVDNRWWDLLQAACGNSGYKTDAYTLGQIRAGKIPACRGCETAVGETA
ncbi:hypothetical protein [Streptomyces sp. 351MFTsu5.1]|uniref:hypothetical protein n=1 Tax=Streptomyces sp. 351MFTsu5.1 TaxID=1172180 RepID=UPI000379C7E4|nr:hypothetical protein [Streptomyces sp. 351MFTsu5.1]